jgi:hypothetical protein
VKETRSAICKHLMLFIDFQRQGLYENIQREGFQLKRSKERVEKKEK